MTKAHVERSLLTIEQPFGSLIARHRHILVRRVEARQTLDADDQDVWRVAAALDAFFPVCVESVGTRSLGRPLRSHLPQHAARR